MNNVEKAKLLHELLPAEIPAFLQFTEGMCHTIREEEATQRANWQDGFLSFDFWLQLIGQTEKTIEKYGMQLHKNSRLFADQLFEGYMALFLVHCLTVYTTIKKLPNRKFSAAVDLLFGAESDES